MRRNTNIIVQSSLIIATFIISNTLYAAHKVEATFLQLDKKLLNCTQDDWIDWFKIMKKCGIHSVYVQWSDEWICTFETPIGNNNTYWQTLEKIFYASKDQNISLIIGLSYDPKWWQHITASSSKLEDYFTLKKIHNITLYKSLLQKFNNHSNWHGIYIPDEIDDVSWRERERRSLLTKYLSELSEMSKQLDRNKLIHISTFFRGRSDPAIFAKNIYEVLSKTEIDALLLQDGQGKGDPPIETLEVYLKEIKNIFSTNKKIQLKLILEVFQETSADPFNAIPAKPDRIIKQISIAEKYDMPKILFAFYPYLINTINSQDQLFIWFVDFNIK